MKARTGYFYEDTDKSSPEDLLTSDTHMGILDYIVSFLAQSIPPENFMISGMYPIAKILPDCRIIYELDVSVKSAHTVIKSLPFLRKLGVALQTSGKISKFAMNDTEKGYKDGILTYNSDGTPFIAIEITVEDIETGVVWANIAGHDVQIASPERCLADKLISTWSDRRARRVGDFYDVFQIIKTLRLDGMELKRALEAKSFTAGKIVAFTEQEIWDICKAYNKTRFKSMKQRALKSPAFSDVAMLYGEFCSQFAIAWKANEMQRMGTWDFDDSCWSHNYPNPLETAIMWGTITGASSLAYNGLTHYDNMPITLLATKPEMDGMVFGPFSYIHVNWESEDSNFKNFVYANWRLPTVEKAISDFMLAVDVFDDEELLVEAICDFMRSNSTSDVERLKSYCTAHGNSSYKISQYFADAASMLEY